MSEVIRIQAWDVPHAIERKLHLVWKRTRHWHLIKGRAMGLARMRREMLQWHARHVLAGSNIGWGWQTSPVVLCGHAGRWRWWRRVLWTWHWVHVARGWRMLSQGWRARVLLMLLMLRRSLLLWHVLAGVVRRVRELLTLRVSWLLVLVCILEPIARTSDDRSRLHRLLKPRRFGLQNDVYTHQLPFSTVDRAPFVYNACNSVLNSSIVPRKLNVLVLNELVDDSATVWGRDLVHRLLDVIMVSTKLVQFAVEFLECDVLLLRCCILPGSGVPWLL